MSALDDNLEQLFPGKSNERLRETFKYLRGGCIQMKYLGEIVARQFAINKAMTSRHERTYWKLTTLREINDALAWLNRLSRDFSQCALELYMNLRTEDKFMFGDAPSEGQRTPLLDLSEGMRQAALFAGEPDERSVRRGDPNSGGGGGGGSGAPGGSPPIGAGSDQGRDTSRLVDARRPDGDAASEVARFFGQ